MKTSHKCEFKHLFPIFQEHFTGNLNKARVRLITFFILSLIKSKSINLVKVAAGFESKTQKLSNYRRIQRFISETILPMDLVSKLIFSLLPEKKSLILALDRTNWKFGDKDINILMLGVCFKNISIPLMFTMLDKRGNSNTQERIDLMERFIGLFGALCIDSLLADREFVGEDWIGFLNNNRIRYHIRIRNNFKVLIPKTQQLVSAWHLFNNLPIGSCKHYHKIVKLKGEYCYLSGMKTIKNGKVDFCIIISFNKPEESLEYYKKRWQIESMFKGFKSSGFNLEDTHVTHLERLEKLVLLTMIAFLWCYKIGDYIDTYIKEIKIKKHGFRAISVFKYGLDNLNHTLSSGFNILNISYLQFFVV